MTLDTTRVLVTGGAGFIGSHLVDALVAAGHDVVVLDDLSEGRGTGFGREDTTARVGTVLDTEVLDEALAGVEVVFHLAALRAVGRSVDAPLATDDVNTHGTLAVFDRARRAGVRRVVHASSSSVYGGAPQEPTPEGALVRPRSPYAVSKVAGELYASVFAELFGLETVSLRYFNVYGPRQRPDSQYAAVIPLFIDAMLHDREVTLHGDGEQSRDFTFVSDTVAGTIAAAAAPASTSSGHAYNIAAGRSASLLEVLTVLGEITGRTPRVVHTESRVGDVRHTRGDPAAATRDLGFSCRIDLEAGLRATVAAFSG